MAGRSLGVFPRWIPGQLCHRTTAWPSPPRAAARPLACWSPLLTQAAGTCVGSDQKRLGQLVASVPLPSASPSHCWSLCTNSHRPQRMLQLLVAWPVVRFWGAGSVRFSQVLGCRGGQVLGCRGGQVLGCRGAVHLGLPSVRLPEARELTGAATRPPLGLPLGLLLPRMC